jgi:hypothetical protein
LHFAGIKLLLYRGWQGGDKSEKKGWDWSVAGIYDVIYRGVGQISCSSHPQNVHCYIIMTYHSILNNLETKDLPIFP